MCVGRRRTQTVPIASPHPPPAQIYSGGSVGGASLLNEGEAQVVMNWSGGMHHAKKGEASGAQHAARRRSDTPLLHAGGGLLPVLAGVGGSLLPLSQAGAPCKGGANNAHGQRGVQTKVLGTGGWRVNQSKPEQPLAPPSACRLLLHQRHCAGHPGAAQGAPAVSEADVTQGRPVGCRPGSLSSSGGGVWSGGSSSSSSSSSIWAAQLWRPVKAPVRRAWSSRGELQQCVARGRCQSPPPLDGRDPLIWIPLFATCPPPPPLACDPCSVLYVDIDIHHGDGVEEVGAKGGLWVAAGGGDRRGRHASCTKGRTGCVHARASGSLCRLPQLWPSTRT